MIDLTIHAHNARAIASEWWDLPRHIKVEMYDSQRFPKGKAKYLQHCVHGRYGLVYIPEFETLYISIRSGRKLTS